MPCRRPSAARATRGVQSRSPLAKRTLTEDLAGSLESHCYVAIQSIA